MAKLATVDDLKVRLSLSEDGPEDIDTLASAVLDAATLHLASILRTDFERRTVSDKFWIDPEQEPWTGNFIQLYLSQGFLFEDADATPDPVLTVVRTSETIKGVSTGTIIDSDIILVDKVKGLILITEGNEYDISVPSYNSRNTKYFMQADYTAGFTSKQTAFGKVFSDVPEWLQEAAILQASALFKGDCPDDDVTCTSETKLLIERYIRFFPSARKAIL